MKMSDPEPIDVATSGYLLTNYPPEYALFAIFSPVRDHQINVIHQTHRLPILPIPQHPPFVIEASEKTSTQSSQSVQSTQSSQSTQSTQSGMYQFRIREYVYQALRVMFDRVNDIIIEYHRAGFSSNVIIIEIQIRHDFTLNSKERDLNIQTCNDLSEPYHQTIVSLLHDTN
jgi:hypothetical protein